nr:unnamed protein product [Digitaria exilis]
MSPPASHRRRSQHLRWPVLFVAILAVHSLAVYLFTRGFLLTRTELDLHSSRDDRPPQGDVSAGCSSWPPPAVDRLVIVVLDALRFDFVAPSTFFPEKHPWMDKLPVLQELAANEKTSARIFKALADPPTTSLQRLKALTTGGLPTFIDVGNSFGAPAIVEDNIMHQLVKNGKRVVMMGDDTWIQLYPEHFNKSFPYPSFNVKDLDTVDNGVIEHLLPSLHKNDWDVLIAHFLGVDHAGHIFGVDSTPMIQKLEQYNQILEGVIDTLRSLSNPGGTHENNLLLVMGDHGQTLNGDHGGGTAEEVETSLFAWSPNTPPDAVLSVLDDSSCNADLNGEEVCISTMQQLDFAATISALLGIPFPFGSIGRVNPELYALSTGTWFNQKMGTDACTSQNDLEAWMSRYAEVLCVNCWQVKRYIDQYSATSVIGFPSEDLQHITNLYSRAQANSSASFRTTCSSEAGSQDKLEGKGSVLPQQIDAYTDFLQTFAKLSRSAWTEFDLWSMGIGLLLMILSVIIQACTLIKLNTICQPSDQKSHSSIIPKFSFAFALVVIRAASFLSNSYILAEGRVAHFLLATSCITGVWYSMVEGKFGVEVSIPGLEILYYFIYSLVQSSSDILYSIDLQNLVFLLLNIFARFGIEIGMSKQLPAPAITKDHSVSAICNMSEVLEVLCFVCNDGELSWCIIKSQQRHQRESELSVAEPVLVIQWSLLAVCLFYLTGHWCTFDGLRYGAAFIGFDHFHIIRQGLLLSIDTFGVSHILPILSLPFIAMVWYNTTSKDNKLKDVILNNITQVLFMYGLITAIPATLTIICVTIQRRHLMVWGLFAPKYVFDAIGLLLTDLLICLASLYYN